MDSGQVHHSGEVRSLTRAGTERAGYERQPAADPAGLTVTGRVELAVASQEVLLLEVTGLLELSMGRRIGKVERAEHLCRAGVGHLADLTEHL